ncbi:MAG: YicC family protein [candidate division Zixibacteria bacterium]|nr:YicC family protein [candidate division Zixibacteria bacterium]
MTGYGRGEVARDGYRAVFELSSVNSRFLEVSLRLPRALAGLEPALRSLVESRLSRGKIYCQLTWERTAWAPSQELNEPLADWYITTLRRLGAKHKLSLDLSVGDLTRIPDMWMAQTEGVSEKIEAILRESLSQSLDQMKVTRRTEGQALCDDMRKRLANVERLTARVRSLADLVPAAIREKLAARLREILGDAGLDPQRLAQEVALLAERADITEECVRLQVHTQNFSAALDDAEAVGRRLNFLLQEMNREANTIGSKSNTADISTLVVELKEELERMREQVQNIE